MNTTPALTIEDLKQGKKVPWAQRLVVLRERFPSIDMNWRGAFQEDIELFGRIWRDILKVDQTVPGRSGPRPVLNRPEAIATMRQWMGMDYSDFDFPDALRVLSGGASQRSIAHKTGLDRNFIQKLLSGRKLPDLWTMEAIAKSYKKKPSYFLEYRTMYILGALGDQMDKSPELTVDLYKKLKGR